jgi:hypothetical protein
MNKERDVKSTMHDIDFKFARDVMKSRTSSNRNYLYATQLYHEDKQLAREKVNTESVEELHLFIISELEEYLKKHPGNSKDHFMQQEIKWAKERQSIFSEYRTDDYQNKYYYILKRWIDLLENWEEPKGFNQSKKKYNYAKVALKLIYEGEVVTNGNKYVLAKKLGLPSGKNLYKAYRKWHKQSERIGEPETPSRTKFKNKIELLESVTKELSPKAKEINIDEIKTLNARYIAFFP